jgi:hypothetical protein
LSREVRPTSGLRGGPSQFQLVHVTTTTIPKPYEKSRPKFLQSTTNSVQVSSFPAMDTVPAYPEARDSHAQPASSQRTQCQNIQNKQNASKSRIPYLHSGLQRHQIHPVTNRSNEQNRKYPVFFPVHSSHPTTLMKLTATCPA